MDWGYNPDLASATHEVGDRLAEVESVTKTVASAFRFEDGYVRFREYGERVRNKAERWV